MSREIKFRGWYPSVKKMRNFSDGIIIADDQDRYGMFFKCTEGNVFLSKCEVMQFTGLEDKNGKEIYEGDLFPNHFNSKVIGIVRFGEYISMGDDNHGGHVGFFIDWESDDMLRKDLAYWVKVSHVIGNVWENPELLEVTPCS